LLGELANDVLKHNNAQDWIVGLGSLEIKANQTLGWCRQREKIDWQEPRKFDCRLVRMIFIFCCP